MKISSASATGDSRPGGQFPGGRGSDLTQRTMAACDEYGVQTLLVTGGVAANSALRASFEQRAPRRGCRFTSLRG